MGETAGIEIRLLGSVGLATSSGLLELGGAQKRAVLAALALDLNAVVSTGRLLEALWERDAPPSAMSTLRGLVGRLRAQLQDGAGGPSLRWQGSGYVLSADPAQVDAVRFEREVDSAHSATRLGDHAAAAVALRTALARWRGPALEEVSARTYFRPHAARLDEARLAAVEDLAEAELACGAPRTALAVLEPQLATQPLRERGWQLDMLALYRLGRQADALRAYRQARALLVDQLGIEPGPELRALEQRVLRQDPALLHGAATGLDAPLGPDAFIGRAAELDAVAEQLERSRVVTLTGVGGAGKTRLAARAAAAASARFPDGVHVVELDRVSSPDHVGPTVSAGLGLLPGGGETATEAVCRHLRRRRSLLVLDGCERVLDEAARLVAAVVDRCPHVGVLLTGRQALGLVGEVVLGVPPMSLPLAGERNPAELRRADSVALFCARAAQADPSFALTPANAAEVVQICHRLDGLPLALELAAARARVLTVGQIADRVEHRLRLVAGTDPAARARHRTLRAAIAWSHDLLPDTQRAMLRRLSAFPASFDLGAVEAVAPPAGEDAVDVLTGLVEKSLVAVTKGTGGARYRLLETIREYAAERAEEAGETDEARRRHRDHVLAGVCVWESPNYFTHFAQWAYLRRAVAERDDILAALEWSWEEGDLAAVLRLAAPCWVAWVFSGEAAGLLWLERAAAVLAPEDANGCVAARIGLGFMLQAFGRGEDPGERARLLLDDALAIAEDSDDPRARIEATFFRSEVALNAGRTAEFRLMNRQVLDLCGHDPGTLTWRAWSHQHLGWAAMADRDLAGARTNLRTALDLGRAAGDDVGRTHVLGQLALVAALAGDGADAVALGRQAVEAAREPSARVVLVMALVRATQAAVLAGEAPRARETFDELVGLLRSLGTRRWVAETLELGVLVLPGQAAAAVALGAAQAARGTPDLPGGDLGLLGPSIAERVADLRSGLGEPAFSRHVDRGLAMPPDDALDHLGSALSQADLSYDPLSSSSESVGHHLG